MDDFSARVAAASRSNTATPSAQTLDAILGLSRPIPTSAEILDLSLTLLDPWSNQEHPTQPFKPYDRKHLEDLKDSMSRHGLLSPIVVRPIGMRYQILCGHNRVTAADELGWTKIKAVVLRDLTDQEAADIMVDSNFHQRDFILPSERAFGWKIKMDGMRHQGKAASSHNETKGQRSDEALAEAEGVTRATIQRYISLTRLAPPLLDLVDGYQWEKNEWVLLPERPIIPLTAAVLLTDLGPIVQQELAYQIKLHRIKRLTQAQAQALKDMDITATPKDRVARVLGLSGEGEGGRGKPVPLRLSLDPAAFACDSAELKAYFTEAALHEKIMNTIENYVRQRQTEKGDKESDEYFESPTPADS